MNTEYLDYLPPLLRLPAAQLYITGLKDKLVPIFGSVDRARRMLVRTLAPDHCLLAIRGWDPIGILSIQTLESGFWNLTPKCMMDEFGWFSGLFKYGGLALLHHEPSAEQWHIDGVAVDKKMRGKGIGTQLLAHLETMALNRGIGLLSLEVVDTNPKAKALYERLGYIETERKSIWPFGGWYGFPFKSAALMVKEISHDNNSGKFGELNTPKRTGIQNSKQLGGI